jgi:hypothetical protein
MFGAVDCRPAALFELAVPFIEPAHGPHGTASSGDERIF